MSVVVARLVLLFGLVFGATSATDTNADIEFADVSHEVNELSSAAVELGRGVNDATAVVGSIFRMKVPNDAFVGSPRKYSAKGKNGGALPVWLSFNEEGGVFEGVPLNEDVGHYLIRVKATALQGQGGAYDDFSLEAVPRFYEHEKSKAVVGQETCPAGSDLTITSVLLDRDPLKTDGITRVSMVRGFAMFFSIDADKVDLMSLPQADVESAFEAGDVIRSGRGNVAARERKQRTAFTLQWLVGCDGNIWASAEKKLKDVEESAKGGLLATILMNTGVISWHVSTFAPNFRSRRQVGSGLGPDPTVSGVTDQEPGEEEGDVDTDLFGWPTNRDNEIPDDDLNFAGVGRPSSIVAPSPVFRKSETSATAPVELDSFPEIELSSSRIPSVVAPILRSYVPLSTPVRVPVKPTLILDASALDDLYTIPDDLMTAVLSTASVVEQSPIVGFDDVLAPSLSLSTPIISTSIIMAPYDAENEIDGVIEPTATIDMPTGFSTSTPTHVTTPGIDEFAPEGRKNRPPSLNKRLPKKPVGAGTVFKIPIPDDTFEDFEQGNTRNLRLVLKMENGSALSSDSWIQFDPQPQIIYGLAAEKDIGRWKFELEAMDNEGDFVTDMIEIMVRQDSSSRVINHEFSVHLKLRKKFAAVYENEVDWQIVLVEKLSDIFGDADTRNIHVLSVTNMTGGPTEGLTLTWRNNSLPTHSCPEEEIVKLLNTLTANKEGFLKRSVIDSLLPEFEGVRAWLDFKGSCRTSTPPVEPPTVKPPAAGPEKVNKKPVVHHQIDKIVAYFGKLKRFTVPEDTFFDEEDGNTRKLRLELKTAQDYGPIPPDNWLQFDSINQEFYGLPMESDPRSQEYALKCTDSAGDFVNDGLVVMVLARPFERVNVEFSVTIDARFEEFIVDTAAKTMFVRKIAELFGDSDTHHISIKSFDAGSVNVTWYNSSLPYDPCPHDQIETLQKIMIHGVNGSVTRRLVETFLPQFNVTAASLTPIRNCLGERTPVARPPPAEIAPESEPNAEATDFLVTYIVPAVTLAAMILAAMIIFCILYRRRRKGVMEANKSLKNKGIPVIFREEMDDGNKRDSGKQPIIMGREDEDGLDPRRTLPPPRYGSSPAPTADPMEITPLRDSVDLLDGTEEEFYPYRARNYPGSAAAGSHRSPAAQRAREMDDLTGSPPYQPPPPFPMESVSGHGHPHGPGGNRMHGARPNPPPNYSKPPPYVPP